MQPKFLLLTSSPPGDCGVGQIIVGEICKYYPLDKLCCFATLRANEHWVLPPEFSELPVKTAKRRLEHHRFDASRPLGRAASWLPYRLVFQRHCSGLVQQAVAFGREQRCDAMFSILDSATNMEIADEVATRLAIPKYTLVWDPPDFIGTHLWQTPWTLSRLLQAFHTAVSGSKRLAVVSDPMAQKYETDYRVPTVLLRHAAPSIASSRGPELRTDTLVIGFAGSVSAAPQLNLLAAALDSLDWSVAGRPVELHLYGLRFVLESRVPRNIRYCGYHSVPSTVAQLAATADVLFMPQPFDEASRSFTELSFPTKLSTYFASCRPILLHSPAYSSLGKFLEQCPFGVWCQDMEIDSLRKSLLTIITQPELRQRSLQAIQQAVAQDFNPSRFKEQLFAFLGIETDWQKLPGK